MYELAWTGFCHDVSGAIKAVRVENPDGRPGPSVVTDEQRLGFDEELAPRVWSVGAAIAHIGNVG